MKNNRTFIDFIPDLKLQFGSTTSSRCDLNTKTYRRKFLNLCTPAVDFYAYVNSFVANYKNKSSHKHGSHKLFLIHMNMYQQIIVLFNGWRQIENQSYVCRANFLEKKEEKINMHVWTCMPN